MPIAQRGASARAAGNGCESKIESSLDGFSGLATDAEGRLWAVSESGLLGLIEGEQRIGSPVQIHGIDAHLEIEALAFLPNGDLVLGTEVDRERVSDKILLARKSPLDGQISVYRSLEFDYGAWSIEPRADQGVEGVCATESVVLAVGEPILNQDGSRLAPLGRWDLETEVWKRYYIELTSKKGKLSGISCRELDGRLEFVAIERDFGVTHILRGVVPADERAIIRPKLKRDWSGISSNLEGVSWQPDGTLLMIDDNFYQSQRSGSSRLYRCVLDSPPLS